MSLTVLTAKIAAAKSVIASGTITGILAFVVSEALTSNAVFAVCLSAACSVLVALVRSRPHIIAARTAAESSVVAEWASLLARANELHAEQLRQANALAVEQLRRLREKNDAMEKIMALMRNTKHNIAGAYQSAVFHIQGLHSLCRDKGFSEFPSFAIVNLKQLTAHEDREVLKLRGVGEASDE